MAEQRKRRADIKAAYKKWQSLAIVAEQFGVSRARVSQIVNSQSK